MQEWCNTGIGISKGPQPWSGQYSIRKQRNIPTGSGRNAPEPVVIIAVAAAATVGVG